MGRLAHTGWAGVKRVRVDATDCPVARERLRKLREVERLAASGAPMPSPASRWTSTSASTTTSGPITLWE